MKRDRNDVLRSISQLLAEVNQVSGTAHSPAPKQSKESALEDGLISERQVSAIIDELQRFVAATGQGRDRKALERLVQRTLNSAIQNWMDANLHDIVNEIINQELSKPKNRRVG
jgi:cell pole-organizing protein PopZ